VARRPRLDLEEAGGVQLLVVLHGLEAARSGAGEPLTRRLNTRCPLGLPVGEAPKGSYFKLEIGIFSEFCGRY
jgi:hypothetical protein